VLFSAAPIPVEAEQQVPQPEVVQVAAAQTEQQQQTIADESPEAETLALNTLNSLADAAEQRWINLGLSAEQLQALNGLTYEIVDLPGYAVGAYNGDLNVIQIDDDAGGYFWFTDSTPLDDAEFATPVSGVADRIDLLSVLMHEQGHHLGLLDGSAGTGVMDPLISSGQRFLPLYGQAQGATADSLAGTHYMAVTAPWIFQGPAPTQNGQLEPNVTPNRNITGAIHTVLAHPTNPDILYIGAVNGGIWKTNNATAVNPTWVPQIDFQNSLSIGAMAFDASDATGNTLVAGVASYSSFGGVSGDRGSIYVTTDGGATWVDPGSSGLGTQNISGIAIRGNTIVVTSTTSGGIFRSTDGGATFSVITDADFVSGTDFSDLVADQSDVTGQRLYAAGTGGSNPGGIYRSDDFGANWTKITSASIDLEMDDLLSASNNIEITVHATTGRLYVAVLVGSRPVGIFHTNTGTNVSPTWTQMDIPVLPLGSATALTGASNTSDIQITSVAHGLGSNDFVVISGVTGNTAANGFYQITKIDANTFSLDSTTGSGAYISGGTWTHVTGPSPSFKDIDETGAQGRIHFSITVDPTNENILYIGGDRQERPNNPIGDTTYGGAIFRGDASIARDPSQVPSPQWDHLTHDIVAFDPSGGTANGTAPHADSREMTFDANGNLIEVDDGGIFRRTSPRDNTGDWFTLAGDLGVIEFHDIAYDNLTNTIIGGTQDNGTHFQIAAGNPLWDFLSGGDGGDVEVDNITLAGSNQSIRYSSFQNLGGFRRTVWDANNNRISTTFPTLTEINGSPNFSAQFTTPIELNAVNPTSILFAGSNGLYESFDSGATIDRVSTFNTSDTTLGEPLIFGGFMGATANASLIYAGGSSGNITVRTTAGDTFVTTNTSGGGSIRDIAINPIDYSQAFALDSNQIFMTTNTGGVWSDVTGNLTADFGVNSFYSVQYIAGAAFDAVVVGTERGVYYSLSGDGFSVWSTFGTNLPNVLAWELDYDATDDLLVVGTMGRGAWLMTGVQAALVAVEVSLIGNDLVFERAGNLADNLTITSDGTNVILSDPTQLISASVGVVSADQHTVTVSLSSFSGNVLVRTGLGDDVITVGSVSTFSRALDLDGQGGNDTIQLNSQLNLNGNLDLTGETINLNTPTITTTGSQEYNGPVTLMTDVTLAGSSVILQSVDSNAVTARSLTVNTSGNGQTVFGGALGSNFALNGLTTNADGKSLLGGNIATTGSVTFNNAVQLTADVTISDSGPSGVIFNNTVDSIPPSGAFPGYTSTAIAFSYEDISGTGTDLNLSDDGVAGQMLSFLFPFFGQNYSSLTIGANGAILLGTTTGDVSAFNENLLSSTIPSQPVIAPLWNDWNPSDPDSDNVYFQILGAAGIDRRAVIQWNNLDAFQGSGNLVNFQAVIFENGEIEFRYLDVDTNVADPNTNGDYGNNRYP